MEFYTEIRVSKSQADTMLYQLVNDWEKRRMERFSLEKLLKVAFDAYGKGISLFSIVKLKNQKRTV